MHPSARRLRKPPTGGFATALDRRASARLPADVLGFKSDARLGQGVHVRLIDVSADGALVEQHDWMRPGTSTVLCLTRTTARAEETIVAHGTIVRSWVQHLTPLAYRSAIQFYRGSQSKPS